MIEYIEKLLKEVIATQKFHTELYEREPNLENNYKLHYWDGQRDVLEKLLEYKKGCVS